MRCIVVFLGELAIGVPHWPRISLKTRYNLVLDRLVGQL